MALPAAVDKVPVRAKYVDLLGNPAVGTVEFRVSPAALADIPDLVTIIPTVIVAAIDPTGLLSVSLPATDDPDLIPTGFTYQVTEKFTGLVGRTFSISVPIAAKTAGIDLTNIAPVSPSGGTGSVGTASWASLKPAGGIPESDMASAVQTKIDAGAGAASAAQVALTAANAAQAAADSASTTASAAQTSAQAAQAALANIW